MGKIIGAVLLIMVAVTCLGVVGKYLGLFGQVASLPADIASKTLDADNVIRNYEWFKQEYADITLMTTKIANSEDAVLKFSIIAGDHDAWTFEDKQEYNRLNSVVLGLKNQKATMIAEYNARSHMANRDIFKTNDLPEQITETVE